MKRTEQRDSKWIFPFVSYLPEIQTTDKMPLIIQLHGAGERGFGKDDLKLVDVHGFSKLLNTSDYPCLFVMPQCPEDTFWAARVESIIKFVEQLKNEYNIDENKVYLTGLSMGGYGTWFTSMARPDLFTAIAPVCGGGMAWNAGVLKMPVWAFHGSDDDVVSPIQSDEMVESLKANNLNVKYTRLDGVGHNAWDYAYNDELIKWFLSQQKNS